MWILGQIIIVSNLSENRYVTFYYFQFNWELTIDFSWFCPSLTSNRRCEIENKCLGPKTCEKTAFESLPVTSKRKYDLRSHFLGVNHFFRQFPRIPPSFFSRKFSLNIYKKSVINCNIFASAFGVGATDADVLGLYSNFAGLLFASNVWLRTLFRNFKYSR